MQDLTLTMSLLKGNIVNIRWNYANEGSYSPFEVPENIVNVNRTDYSVDSTLADFVNITQDTEGPFTIEVKNVPGPTGEIIYTLNGMILDTHFSLMSHIMHVYQPNYKGVIGLMDQVSNSLFLKDGVYSLWNRAAESPIADGMSPGKNLQGSSPYLMARANDSNWFGIYSNNAAAQDWWLTNEPASGKVYLKTIAAGGTGDLFIFHSDSPDQVVA